MASISTLSDHFTDFKSIEFTLKQIAKLCGVSTRTARRWTAGHSENPKGIHDYLELHQDGRIMPRKWPYYFRFNGQLLDIGQKQALAWQQIGCYIYSISLWHKHLKADS